MTGSLLRDQQPLLTVAIVRETDLLLARRRAVEIAALLGMERQDQTRIATALSEIVRNAYSYAQSGRVEFFVERIPRVGLRVIVQDSGPGIAQIDDLLGGTYRSPTGMGLGILGAKRLSDGFDLQTGPEGTRIVLWKYIHPAPRTVPTNADLSRALAASRSGDAMAVLADQNQEMMQLLDQLRIREGELERLNSELEETNRGVMVLYSELEDKAEAVQQANEMKTRFLSTVTHELRTPLNSIVSLSRLLLQHTDGDLAPEQEKQVGFILRSAQNLTELVNDLLDLAKVEAGKITLRTSQVAVADIFSALRGMFRPIAQGGNVEFRVEFPEAPLEMLTDEGKLSQILRNFISNALKFTEQGEVVLRCWTEAGSVVFSVRDTGIGIAPENHELVLQEWAQIESPGPSHHRGSGLGLPLAKKFTELLRGEMWFASELGKGSEFFLRLPLLENPPVAGPAKQQATIVIVDDDEVARYLLRRQLSALTSATVLEAEDGTAGLALIRQHRPQLAILDLVMPGLTGIQVAEALRGEGQFRELRTLLITSKPLDVAERATLKHLDVETLSKKDVTHEELQVALERALLEVGLRNLHEERSEG